MATSQLAESLLGGLEPDTKRVLTEVFRYLVPNGRFGPVSHQLKSENFQGYYVTSTTHTTADTEFSVVHGLGRTPYLAIPVLAMDQVNSRVVPLQVSRAADGARIYLKSASTNAVINLYLE